MSFRVTALTPVRYAYWPAQPTRKVGTLFGPCDEALILSDKQYRDIRFVSVGDEPEYAIVTERID